MKLSKTVKIAVLGDVIVDKYVYLCKDKVSPHGTESYYHMRTDFIPGGSAHVANILATFDDTEVYLYPMIGVMNDDNYYLMLENLQTRVNVYAYASIRAKVTVKERHILGDTILSQINIDNYAYSTLYSSFTIDNMSCIYPDIVVLEDYNKGTITKNALDEILTYCYRKQIPVFMDPKVLFPLYPVGTIDKPVFCLKMNMKEFQHITSICSNMTYGTVVERLLSLSTKLHNVENIIVTVGHLGCFWYSKISNSVQYYPTEELVNPDTCGAGDHYIATLSYGYNLYKNMEQAIKLAVRVSTESCKYFGTMVVPKDKLKSLLL